MKYVFLSLSLVVCLKMSPANAVSTFRELKGEFEVIRVITSNSNFQIKEGDIVRVSSSELEATLSIGDLEATNSIVKKMVEYEFSEEGHFSYARFYQTPRGARWVSASNDSGGSEVVLEHVVENTFFLKIFPRMNRYDSREYVLLLERKVSI